jgi:hypothetical protein
MIRPAGASHTLALVLMIRWNITKSLRVGQFAKVLV